MSPSLLLFITHYGYLAVFVLIIAQELGAPIPFPNELFLMFFGYLAFTGSFDLALVGLVALAASMLGAWILYGASYFLGVWIHKKLPMKLKNLVDTFSEKIARAPFWTVFAGRVIPFGRGYVCLAAGFTKVSPQTFASATLISDSIWNLGFVFLGFISGPYWERVAEKVGGIEHLVIIIVVAFLVITLCNYLYKKYQSSAHA